MSFPSCHSTRGVIRSRRGRNVIYVHVSCLWPWNIPAMCSACISDITGCVSGVDEEKGFQMIHMRMAGQAGLADGHHSVETPSSSSGQWTRATCGHLSRRPASLLLSLVLLEKTSTSQLCVFKTRCASGIKLEIHTMTADTSWPAVWLNDWLFSIGYWPFQ